jgi:hypothetical protein
MAQGNEYLIFDHKASSNAHILIDNENDCEEIEIELNEYNENLNLLASTTDEELEVQLEESHTSKDLLPCAIVDIIEGKVQRCNNVSNLRHLRQLIGIWK